jgi:hypothetical protein
MEARGVVPMHRANTRRHLERITADCDFGRLADLDRERFERWLATETQANRSARSRNAHHTALVSVLQLVRGTLHQPTSQQPVRGGAKSR